MLAVEPGHRCWQLLQQVLLVMFLHRLPNKPVDELCLTWQPVLWVLLLLGAEPSQCVGCATTLAAAATSALPDLHHMDPGTCCKAVDWLSACQSAGGSYRTFLHMHMAVRVFAD